MRGINHVTLSGNLTRDPELKSTAGGTSICSLRLAVNDSVKDPQTGEWGDRPNYFNVDSFGAAAERDAARLAKGDHITVDGRLRWRDWQTNDGSKREAVSVVADFIEYPRNAPAGAEGVAHRSAGGPACDDDIPF